MEDFFAAHSRLGETSQTGSTLTRLRHRHAAIIDWNRRIFPGARVLDVASHDGRWSLAALEAGAAHVLAIEARPHLVQNAADTFEHYGIAADRYELVEAEVFGHLRRGPPSVDVVLLLGFFYHLANHVEAVRLLSETGAKHIIVDTNIVPDHELHPTKQSVISVVFEPVEEEHARADLERQGQTHSPVGLPSRRAVVELFEHFGFRAEEFAWEVYLNEFDEVPDLYDYNCGRRTTYRMTRD